MDTVLRNLTDTQGRHSPQEPLESKRECPRACTRLAARGAREASPGEGDPSRGWKEGQGGLSFLPEAAWLEGHTPWLSSEARVLGKSGTRERLPEAIGSRRFHGWGFTAHITLGLGGQTYGRASQRQRVGAEGPGQRDQGSGPAEGAGERVQE